MTGGGAKINLGGGTENLFMLIREGHGGTLIYSSVDQTNEMNTKKKKIFSSKISTDSGHRLKILAIFHEFLSVEQKKRGLRPKSSMKSGVSPQKLRKYER